MRPLSWGLIHQTHRSVIVSSPRRRGDLQHFLLDTKKSQNKRDQYDQIKEHIVCALFFSNKIPNKHANYISGNEIV